MTTILCASDLHEHLVDIPPCDLLLLAGDVSLARKGDLPAKQALLVGAFKDWLDRVPAEEVVLVAGNHDQSIEAWGFPDGLRCHYLQDAGLELFGRRSSRRSRPAPTSWWRTVRRADTATAPAGRAGTRTSAQRR